MIYDISNEFLTEGVTISKTAHKNFINEVRKVIESVQSSLEDMDIPSGFLGLQKGNVLGNDTAFQKSCEIALSKIKVNASRYSVIINVSALAWNDINKNGKKRITNAIKSCGYSEKKRTFGDKVLNISTMYKKLDDKVIICHHSEESNLNTATATSTSFVRLMFKCADLNDKTKKSLGLSEGVTAMNKFSIFESVELI